jgi:hypothetical protein
MFGSLFIFKPISFTLKMKVGLCDLHAVYVSVYPAINFWMDELISMKLGMYVMELEPISTAYIINPSHLSVCLYVYPI